MATRKLKTAFTIFCNQMFGETKRFFTLEECLESMTKRHNKFWSNIKWKDEEGRTINFSREFFEEQGMSKEEIISDWLEHASKEELFEDTIYTIN